MRTPVKLNRAHWPRALTALLPSAADPRILLTGCGDAAAFSEAVSTFKFGTTLKTTQAARFPRTIEALAELDFRVPPVILDVGASDASTSLDVMQAVAFARYYVTDAHVTVSCVEAGGRAYFYDRVGQCVLVATDGWIAYCDTRGALPGLDRIAQSLIAGAPPASTRARTIELINPALLRDKRDRVCVEHYDMFEPWTRERVDLVIAANILNRSYFSDADLLRAVANLANALRADGRLAVIDNRPDEKATMFRMGEDGLGVEKRINGGTEIEGLVLHVIAMGGGPLGSRCACS